ncbi:cytochrome c oxidase assembly protein [Ollibium composti]|jgi:cytochrome c oxidase assembly protein subunit 11|uniref:Cytochrome c oxidase assembly protein CtaG n=1 Tax=Ollibium composti TaxID=2675109 RepID=A0ABY2Q666_9HYPH|nr:cytochrome c oxidase assembly protein [Mesorhizobium composti]THF55674.1 cytochrome c oxidase assembly protein [Mesorhizobium composti]
MDNQAPSPRPGKQKTNMVIAGTCVAFFAGMIGMAYAAVPLYRVFCQVTGYAGTTQRVEQQYAGKVLDRDITIRFDANTAGVPWDFEPVARSITVKIGETARAHYKAVNKLPTATTGRATFNVTPDLAGAYFNKVECFCFTEQTLKGGETADMPVVFYVDPDIVNQPELKDIKTITLSYTMFPAEGDKPVASAPETGNKINTDTAKTLGG